MPCDAVFAFHDNHVAEERQVAGKNLRDAHHDGAVDVAFAGREEAVVGQMAERGADGDAVEFVENDFRPAAHGEGIDKELVLHLPDGAEQAGGFLQLTVTRAVGRMARRVGEDRFGGVRDFRVRQFFSRREQFMLRDDLDFGAEFSAEQHFGAAACVEARNTSADEADAHAVEGFHRLCAADATEQLFRRVVRARLGMDVEIRNVQPPHVVGVHIRGAEGVALQTAAAGIGLLHAPQDDGNVQTLREHRRDDAQRERHEMRDQQVRTVLFEIFKLRDGFVFKRQHLFSANDFHAWKLFQEGERVGARGLQRIVRPIDFRQWKITDFERVAHDVLLEFYRFIVKILCF